MSDIIVEDLKITRKIYEKQNIVIKMNVPLQKENYRGETQRFHNEYVNDDNKKYITIEMDPFITIEMKDKGPWDKKKSIIVTDDNIQTLVRGFEQIIENMINGGVFARTASGQSVAYGDKIKENTVILNNMLGTQYVMLQPGIYYDEQDDGMSYECCLMYFNRKDLFIPLTVDVLASVYHKLKQIDIFMYSQMMLNYYIMSKDKVVVPPREPRKPKTNVFSNKVDPVQESVVTSKVSANKVSGQTDEDFFGMKEVKK